MTPNKIWTAWSRGTELPDLPYMRVTDIAAYTGKPAVTTCIDSVVPRTPMASMAKYVEELVQLCIRSSLRADALAYDADNTYDKTVLVFPLDPVLGTPLRIPWSRVLVTLESQHIPFANPVYRDTWVSSPLWTDRIAAVVLDLSKQVVP